MLNVNDIIRDIRKHPIFHRARIDAYSPVSQPEKLIVVLGQAHTVWSGKIANRDRKRIVSCQARLCSYYAYFEQFQGVTNFGGEGIYDGLQTSFGDRGSFRLYEETEKMLGIHEPIAIEELSSAAEKILDELGREWQLALRQRDDLQKIQLLSAAVSGHALFSYLNAGKIKVYPIEGEAAYQKVLIGISHLGERIEKLENSSDFQAVKQRGGKIKTAKEVEVVKQFNALVKEFNRLIGSDIRERATMAIVKDRADREGLVVFTMGVAHRRNYLQLVKEYLKGTNTAFVFITAPELLINWWVAIGIPLLIALIFAVVAFY